MNWLQNPDSFRSNYKTKTYRLKTQTLLSTQSRPNRKWSCKEKSILQFYKKSTELQQPILCAPQN